LFPLVSYTSDFQELYLYVVNETNFDATFIFIYDNVLRYEGNLQNQPVSEVNVFQLSVNTYGIDYVVLTYKHAQPEQTKLT